VALVVQKYGGSSVADADGIKRVAQRIVATRKAGDRVVVVVSAMGDSTDELMDLARQVSPLPPGRELASAVPINFSSCAFSSFHSLPNSTDVLPLFPFQMSSL